MAMLDREGRVIKVGDSVALAITMNHHMHYDNFTVRICKEKEGRLYLDGTINWSWLDNHDANSLQVLHENVNLIQLSNAFQAEFSNENSYNRRYIHTEDAHRFYVKIMDALKRRSEPYLATDDHETAQSILLKLLEFSQESEGTLEAKIGDLAVRAACMNEIMQQAAHQVITLQKKK
jgi:hypothetical protein